jgi:hypothetical protein
LAELNDPVRDGATRINAKVMKNLKQGRNDFLASLYRPGLKAVPGERYQYAEWKRCTVAPDYHVEVDDHYYSGCSDSVRAWGFMIVPDTIRN